eukprot:TRINITY_DN11604_c0_g1_i1.p1 TRINITY_DN11604_c0_g1~~TRINITY_DN11604_c0_g1_i1.p1  ORF type:complete len:918 (+),score=263.78 TRINITY_DN11604_c0_g1_i1:65-2818(+)
MDIRRQSVWSTVVPEPDDLDRDAVQMALVKCKEYRDHASWQAQLLTELWKLSRQRKEYRDIIVVFGGLPCIYDIMQTHTGHAEAITKACALIGSLSFNHPENKVELVRDGAVEMIGEAMNHHPKDANVQQHACVAFYNLAANNAANKHRIIEAGGMDVIGSALRTHINVAAVQQYGCAALYNIAANNAENQHVIANEGGIECICSAMAVHREAAAVQQYACSALWTLSMNNSVNQARIEHAGGCELVYAAMRTHSHDAAVQQAACAAIYLIASDEEVCTRMVQSDAIKLCKQALKLHAENAGVTRMAQDALLRLEARRTLMEVENNLRAVTSKRDATAALADAQVEATKQCKAALDTKVDIIEILHKDIEAASNEKVALEHRLAILMKDTSTAMSALTTATTALESAKLNVEKTLDEIEAAENKLDTTTDQIAVTKVELENAIAKHTEISAKGNEKQTADAYQTVGAATVVLENAIHQRQAAEVEYHGAMQLHSNAEDIMKERMEVVINAKQRCDHATADVKQTETDLKAKAMQIAELTATATAEQDALQKLTDEYTQHQAQEMRLQAEARIAAQAFAAAHARGASDVQHAQEQLAEATAKADADAAARLEEEQRATDEAEMLCDERAAIVAEEKAEIARREAEETRQRELVEKQEQRQSKRITLEKAEQLLWQRRKAAMQIGVSDYVALIKGWADAGYLEQARRVLLKIKEHGFAPTAVAYLSLLEGAVRDNSLELAATTYHEMLNLNLRPTMPLVVALLRLCQSNQDWKRTMEIWHGLRLIRALSPSQEAFDITLDICQEHDQPQFAVRVLDEMRACGITPSQERTDAVVALCMSRRSMVDTARRISTLSLRSPDQRAVERSTLEMQLKSPQSGRSGGSLGRARSKSPLAQKPGPPPQYEGSPKRTSGQLRPTYQ